MKVALIADIHANLPALEAVLQHIRQQNIDEIWCLGDIVGYGPFPNECVALVQAHCSRVILGNHDERTSSDIAIEAVIKKTTDPFKTFVFRWTYEALTPQSKQYLRSLPQKDFVAFQGQRIALYHGSPKGINDAVTCYTQMERFQEYGRQAQADIIVLAHSHEVLAQQVDGAWFWNPGSVGRPFNQILKASYGVMDFSHQQPQISFHAIDYDVSPCLLKMREEHFPQELIVALAQAKSPSDVILHEPQDNWILELQYWVQTLGVDYAHAQQVMKLSLLLFDHLQSWHQCTSRERLLLQISSLLHDIGALKNQDNHHIYSKEMILEKMNKQVSLRERVMIALVAYYHRREHPSVTDKDFLYLPDYHKKVVEKLSAILRIAEGLDRSHQSYITNIAVVPQKEFLEIQLESSQEIVVEIQTALKKADLFEKVFHQKIHFLPIPSSSSCS